MTYRIHFKRIVNRRLIMGLADGEVLVDGRLIYTANDLKVGLFQTLPRSNQGQLSSQTLTSIRFVWWAKAKPPLCGGFFYLKRQNQAIKTLSPMASRQPPSQYDL